MLKIIIVKILYQPKKGDYTMKKKNVVKNVLNYCFCFICYFLENIINIFTNHKQQVKYLVGQNILQKRSLSTLKKENAFLKARLAETEKKIIRREKDFGRIFERIKKNIA